MEYEVFLSDIIEADSEEEAQQRFIKCLADGLYDTTYMEVHELQPDS